MSSESVHEQKDSFGGCLKSAVLPSKVSCVRWVPNQLHGTQTFLTSSWDSTLNSVTLWSKFHDALDDDQLSAIPEVLAQKYLPGDIIGFEFVDEQTIACATSEGALSILAITKDSIAEKFSLPKLHASTGSVTACTGISVYGQNVATVGEDGCLNIVATGSQTVLRTIKDNGGCSMCCVAFAMRDLVLVSGRYESIDCYDIRQPSDEPILILSTTIDDELELTDTNTTCISSQPGEDVIAYAGLDNGSIMGWDLRYPDVFATHLKPHDTRVNALAFKKHDAAMMFSATEDGDVYQWLLRRRPCVPLHPSLADNPFTNLVRTYGPVIENYNAINSIDVSSSHMICGGDEGFVYVLELQ